MVSILPLQFWNQNSRETAPKRLGEKARASEQEGTERESRRTISQNFTAKEQKTSDGMAFPSFPPFLLLSSGIVEKGLLQKEAAPLLLRPFSPPKRNIISPAEHEEREERGGTFYPSLNGAMNHEVKKGLGRHAEDRKEGRWAFDREEGRGGDHLSPTEPIKSTARTEWQWGDSFHAAPAPAPAAAPNPRDSRHLLGRMRDRHRRGDRAEEKEETDRQTV